MSDIPKPMSNADAQLKNYGNPDELRPKNVVQGTVIEERFTEKMFKQFFKKDLKTVAKEEVDNVFVPFLKDTLLGFISQMLYGDSYHRGNYYGGSFSQRDYSAISSGYRNNQPRTGFDGGRTVQNAASVFDYKNLGFDTEFEAHEVLGYLRDTIDQYNKVTVGDFYEFSGKRTISNDFSFGWTDLSMARVVKISTPDGPKWKIDLPRAIQL